MEKNNYSKLNNVDSIPEMEGFLTEQQRKELLSELRLERNRKFADRIRVILLLDSGESAIDIAKFLFLHEGTVRNYEKRYKEDGLEGLFIDYQTGRSSYLSQEEQQKLVLELESKIYPTTKAVISYIKKEFGVTYTVGGMTTLLHNLGFSYKKPKGVPGKADTEEQKAFVRKYNRIKKKEGLIYFADSTHPMLNPVLSSGWIRKGRDFDVKTNSGRERVNINGAIEVNTLNVVSRSCKKVNGSSMCDLLRAVRKKHPEERNLYMVLDNAGYNRSYKVRDVGKELGIKIIYLPSYSPNLNPIERLWKYMKKKVMANTYYPDIETFQEELMLFLRGIRKHRQELSTLITDNFHIVKT